VGWGYTGTAFTAWGLGDGYRAEFDRFGVEEKGALYWLAVFVLDLPSLLSKTTRFPHLKI
jgi:hypothetical protein